MKSDFVDKNVYGCFLKWLANSIYKLNIYLECLFVLCNKK